LKGCVRLEIAVKVCRESRKLHENMQVMDEYSRRNVLAWEIEPPRLFCDAGLERTFNRIAREIVCAGEMTGAQERGCLPPSLPRETLQATSIHSGLP
jgi:hypothetical protein